MTGPEDKGPQAKDFAELTERVAAAEMYERNLLQTFGPDTLAEARNRGFRPS